MGKTARNVNIATRSHGFSASAGLGLRAMMLVLVFGLAGLVLAGCDPQNQTPAGVSMETRVDRKPWGSGQRAGEVLLTRHYRIYTTVRDDRLLNILPGFMEAAYDTYTEVTGLSPDGTVGPMPMYMMGTRGDWESLNATQFGRDSGPSVVIENGGYTYKGVTVCYDIGGMATLSVASHEGLHQFLHHRLKDRIPLWAEEGLATTCEGFITEDGFVRFMPDKNVLRIIDLHNALAGGEWIGLEELLTTNTPEQAAKGPGRSLGFYGQLYALCYFLRTHEQYKPRWEAMIRDASEGRYHEVLSPFEQRLAKSRRRSQVGLPIFRHYITEDLEGFEAEYREFAEKLARRK